MNIIVVIDQLYKIRYLITCSDILTLTIAQLFLDYIQKLHKLPKTIISNKGSQFISIFQKELTTQFCIKALLSMAYYPEINGQMECVNAIIKQYIRIYTSYLQDNWIDQLIFTKFTVNNFILETIKVSLFLANYGQHP